MAEIPKQQPSRLDVLRQKGIPSRLLFQMGENGLQYDYRNVWINTIGLLDVFYNPHESINKLNEPNAQDQIKKLVKTPLTYSQYWLTRLHGHKTTNDPQLDIDHTFNLLVTEQEQTPKLDAYATDAQQLADLDVDSTTLVLSFVKIAAQAYKILYDDPEEAKKLLEKFGILQEPTPKES